MGTIENIINRRSQGFAEAGLTEQADLYNRFLEDFYSRQAEGLIDSIPRQVIEEQRKTAMQASGEIHRRKKATYDTPLFRLLTETHLSVSALTKAAFPQGVGRWGSIAHRVRELNMGVRFATQEDLQSLSVLLAQRLSCPTEEIYEQLTPLQDATAPSLLRRRGDALRRH